MCLLLLPKRKPTFKKKKKKERKSTARHSLKQSMNTQLWALSKATRIWEGAVAKHNSSLICCWFLAAVLLACLTLFWKIANSQQCSVFHVQISVSDHNYVYINIEPLVQIQKCFICDKLQNWNKSEQTPALLFNFLIQTIYEGLVLFCSFFTASWEWSEN